MNKIISKIYIVILGLTLIVPTGVFAQEQVSYFKATTLSATSVTTSTAKLSGSVSFNEGLGTAWFQYGTNYNLEESTGTLKYVSKYEGMTQGVSKSIGSLKANTTYYFKVCLETSIKGLTCGNTMSFKTKPAPSVAPVSNTTTSTSTNSNSNSNSNSSSASSNTNDDDKKDDMEEEENSQAASVAGATRDGNFLPDTFLEWILTITLIFFIVLFGRYLYLKRQEEKEEEEKRQKEALIRGQMA